MCLAVNMYILLLLYGSCRSEINGCYVMLCYVILMYFITGTVCREPAEITRDRSLLEVGQSPKVSIQDSDFWTLAHFWIDTDLLVIPCFYWKYGPCENKGIMHYITIVFVTLPSSNCTDETLYNAISTIITKCQTFGSAGAIYIK